LTDLEAKGALGWQKARDHKFLPSMSVTGAVAASKPSNNHMIADPLGSAC